MPTRGNDLLALPGGARPRFAYGAVVEVAGLRNPRGQIENFREGLLAAMLDRDASGAFVRKAGIMGVVVDGGAIAPGRRWEWTCRPSLGNGSSGSDLTGECVHIAARAR